MSEFYDNLAATAARLIEQFGLAVTIKRISGGSVDPVTGAVVSGVETLHTPKGVFKEYREGVVDGTRIKSGDRELTLDASFFPEASDLVLVGEEYWNIVMPIKTISPGGTPLIHKVQVRS